MDEKRGILAAQRNEITEHEIYSYLAHKVKDANNKKALGMIAQDELKNYKVLKSITKQDVSPSKLKFLFYVMLVNIFGPLFALMFMEKNTKESYKLYKNTKLPALKKFLNNEGKHEKHIIKMISDARVQYANVIVLGINDALVEITGVLTGLTFAFGSGKIIAISGFVTGFAAALSMAGSVYLSVREESKLKLKKSPFVQAAYTGIAYLSTVMLLITPYLFLANVYTALILTLLIAVVIITLYTYYITTAKNLGFKARFFEMILISMTVSAISFALGLFLKKVFGVSV